MNSRQKDTWQKIFEDPARCDVEWKAVETMMKALGAEITEGNGSRVRVALDGVRAVFHRPHPERVTDKGALKSVRRFLLEAQTNRGKLKLL